MPGPAGDLLVSQDGLERDLLDALLVKRLRKARSLSEGDARWAVESWRREAVVELNSY